MRVIKHNFLIIFILCFSFAEIYSQVIQTERISIPEGLSSALTREVFQDSYGLIWIPTEEGLNVYDGYKNKIFKNIPGNTKSILDNAIWCVTEDKERNIWVATESGVAKYVSLP